MDLQFPLKQRQDLRGFGDEFATPSEAEMGFEGFCDEFATPFEAKLGFDIWVAPWGGWIYMVLHCFVHEEWIPNFQKPHLHGVCLLLFFTHILCFERWASKSHLHGVCLLLWFCTLRDGNIQFGSVLCMPTPLSLGADEVSGGEFVMAAAHHGYFYDKVFTK